MTSHSDLIQYASKCVAIERNKVRGLRFAGKDVTDAEKELKTAEALLAKLGRQRVDLVRLAGALSNDRWFWLFVQQTLPAKHQADWDRLEDASKAERAANYIREACGIVSRKDLRSDENGQKNFHAMHQKFKDWRRYGEYRK